MKHTIMQTLKTIVLALVLSLGISYVSAWTAPTSQPPAGNTSAPINVSSNPQTKSGALNIATNAISGDTQLGSFSAPGSTAGVGYTTFGSNPGGFVGWDYTNGGIALNSHSAGGSSGGLFVKRVDNTHSNVGIGTISPSNALDVVGSSYFSGTVNASDVYSRTAGKWMSQLGGGVASVSGSGAGISVSPTTGNVVVSNMGVTSLAAGSHVSVSSNTGAVTINATVGTISLGAPFGSGVDNNCNNWGYCVCPSSAVQVGQYFDASSGKVLPVCSYISVN